MEEDPSVIYHLVTEVNFRAGRVLSMYAPESLAGSGFIHCSAGVETTLAVANDYFSGFRGRLLLLEISAGLVLAPLKFEEADPDPCAGTSHLQAGVLFPHIYGPLNLDSVEGVGILGRSETGFTWPDKFIPLF